MSKLARCVLVIAVGPFAVVTVAAAGALVASLAVCLLLNEIADE